MSDVSNRTIVALLAVALVVSVAGTMYSVSELGALGGSYTMLSGAATTGTGDTAITVQGTVAIVVDDAAVDFGNGYVIPGANSATIDSDGSAHLNWLNTAGLVYTVDDHHLINNTGTTIVKLDVESSSTHAENWLCANSDCPSTTSAQLEVKAKNHETGSCDSGVGAIKASYSGSPILTATTTNVVDLCEHFNYDDSYDSLEVDFRVTIPGEASNGGHTTTLTYTATTA